MPDINGLELINFVKKNPNYRDTPLFVVTTEGREQDRARGLALGASEYVVKPFEAPTPGRAGAPVPQALAPRAEADAGALGVRRRGQRDSRGPLARPADARRAARPGARPRPAQRRLSRGPLAQGALGDVRPGRARQARPPAEDLLDALRLGKVALSDELLDTLIDTLDVFTALLAEAAGDERAGAGPLERAHEQADRLRALATPPRARRATRSTASAWTPQVRAVFTEYEEHRLRENVRKGVALWKVRAVFDPRRLRHAAGRAEREAQAARRGDPHPAVLAPGRRGPASPSTSSSAARATAGRSRRLAQQYAASVGPLTSRPSSPPARVTVLTPKRPAPPSIEPERTAARLAALNVPAPEASLRSLTQTVRVDIGRLDGLMNAVGELLLVQGNIAAAGRDRPALGRRAARSQALRPGALAGERARSSASSTSCRGAFSRCAWCRSGQVFDKLARLVRRIVRESGKEIDFDHRRRRRRARQADRRGAVGPADAPHAQRDRPRHRGARGAPRAGKPRRGRGAAAGHPAGQPRGRRGGRRRRRPRRATASARWRSSAG